MFRLTAKEIVVESETTMDDSQSFNAALVFLSYAFSVVEDAFFKLPGSAVLVRYVKSSHQNDPGRTILELILVIFAIRTLLQQRTRADRGGKNFVKYTEEVIQLNISKCQL